MFVMRNLLNRTKRTSILKRSIILRSYNNVSSEDIPDVSPTLIKTTLKLNNVNFEEGFACYITACPMCRKTTKPSSSSPKLYINKITGMFLCPSCMCTGQWNDLKEFFVPKKSKKTKDPKDLNAIFNKDMVTRYLEDVSSNTTRVNSLSQEFLVDIFKKFQLPIVSNKSLEPLDVRIDSTFSNLYFPLENVESQLVGYKVLNDTSDLHKVEPSVTCGGVLIGKPAKSKDTAVLVPNVSDFLALLNSKLSTNVICLPNGLVNLSQYVLPTFERFKKLILWFGSDIQSWDVARSFAKKLGEKRCLFIRPTDKQLLPHLATDQDFKAIISSAQPIWHKSIITFSTLRQDVLSDLQNIDKVQGVKWKRYPTLNKILKGHRKGELTVITGPTGSGKTTFISEYSLDLAMQGVNTLWGSFEIRNARLARTMLQQMAGIPLDENLDKFDFWADQFEQLPIYFMTFHGQQAIKVVMEAVEHATYVHDISHVIIDNVQFMMGMTDEPKHMDRFWKQDAIVASFRNFATRKNCHVSLVIHPRKERDTDDLTTSSIFGGAKASQEADNVLIIQDKRLTSVRGKKYLQVAKNRYSGDLGVMALEFDKASLSYAQKKKKVEEKIDRPLDVEKPIVYEEKT